MISNAPTYLYKLLTFIVIGFGSTAQAGPVGGVVASGSAGIQSNGPTTTVTQTSQKAIVNWQGFNVAPNEAVNFVQPNSSAVMLNRVQSPNGSVIQGQITANGKVFLINPNGILFSQGSSVNVGGFVASTLGISDSNFLSGNYKFSGDSQGTVTNQGSLSTNTEGGYVALIGSKVVNEGVITAKLGTVAMAAGSAVTLDMAGDQLLNVTVDQGVLDALVRNGHLIQADGGQVMMTAQGAGALMSSAVNNTGVIQAQSIQNQNGVIKLTGEATAGVVNVSGTLDVSGTAAGQKGGVVQVTAATVNLNNAKINASGDAGGGQVLVGGNFHGAGPLANAKTTTLDRGTQIDASAIRTGDGGKIAVWSSGTTSVDATFIARGGSQSGNGGFVETSGHVLTLGLHASVNTLAAKGLTGVWLVDPSNYEICSATCSGAIDTTTETPASVIAHLITSNYSISATNNLTVSDAVSFATISRILTLNAGNNILINAVLTASGSDSGFTLIAGNDALISSAVTASNLNSIINVTATRDITATGTLTASQTGTQINLTAHRDISAATVTATGGSGLMNLIADRNVSVTTATATGTATLKADATGNGPGVAAGTVTIGAGGVTAATTVVRFNPVSYATTATEIAAYTGKITGAKDIKAWVFATGVNKEYDTTTAATMAFAGTPTDAGAVTLDPGTAAFTSPGAANAVPITYSGYAISGAASPTLALFSAAGTSSANITPKAVTATATGTNKVYDGNTADAVTMAVTALPGDTLTAASTAANFADKNVGTGKAVSVTGISLGGASAANYTVNTTTATTANITPKAVTATATGADKVYDGTSADAATVAVTAVAGDTLTVASTSATFADKNVGTGKAVSVTCISLGGASAANYTVNTTAATTANITPKNLTATATGTNKVYDGTTADAATVAVTAVAGDTLTVASTSSTFADKNVGTGKAVSVTGISLGGASAANYTVNPIAATTANITPASLTVSATGNNKTSDGTTTATVGLTDNRVAGDALTTNYSSANFTNSTVGDNKLVNVAGISATGTGVSNYVLTNTTATTTANITAATSGGGSAATPPVVAPTTVTPSAVIPAGVTSVGTTPTAVVHVDVASVSATTSAVTSAGVTSAAVTPAAVTPVDVAPSQVVIASNASETVVISPGGAIDLANSDFMLNTQNGGFGASGLINPEVSGVANQLSNEESGQASALSSDQSGTVRVIGVTGGTAAMLAVKPGSLPQQMTSLFPVPASSVVPQGPARTRRQNRN